MRKSIAWWPGLLRSESRTWGFSWTWGFAKMPRPLSGPSGVAQAYRNPPHGLGVLPKTLHRCCPRASSFPRRRESSACQHQRHGYAVDAHLRGRDGSLIGPCCENLHIKMGCSPRGISVSSYKHCNKNRRTKATLVVQVGLTGILHLQFEHGH